MPQCGSKKDKKTKQNKTKQNGCSHTPGLITPNSCNQISLTHSSPVLTDIPLKDGAQIQTKISKDNLTKENLVDLSNLSFQQHENEPKERP